MTRVLYGGDAYHAYEFVVPFVFDGHAFMQGGLLLVRDDGVRFAVTHGVFRRWWAAGVVAEGDTEIVAAAP